MVHRLRTLSLAAAFTVLAATPALAGWAGPPWISIEIPANPYDAATRGAFLVVHAFHHGTPVSFPVAGTAEGIVNGERRSIKLEFTRTGQDGAYALRRQWPSEGTWTLVIRVVQGEQGESGAVTALVELGSEGDVASVKVPTHRQGDWTIPSSVSMAEVDAALRARAALLARKS